MTDDYTLGRYSVVRYPTSWVVIDKQQPVPNGAGAIVFESSNRDTAHARCRKLHKAHRAAQEVQQ